MDPPPLKEVSQLSKVYFASLKSKVQPNIKKPKVKAVKTVKPKVNPPKMPEAAVKVEDEDLQLFVDANPIPAHVPHDDTSMRSPNVPEDDTAIALALVSNT